MQLSLITYDTANEQTQMLANVEELAGREKTAGVTWINVECLDRPEEVNRLAEMYGIHPLTLEDILDPTHQRPKIEEFDNYLFIALKAVNISGELDLEHIGLVITEDTVLTFQEKPGDCFDGIRKRIRENTGRIRRMGTDFLAYRIIDTVVDEYFLSIDAFGSEIENFEDRAMDEKDDTFIRDLQHVKRKLLKLRRAIWPLRESISLMMRMESKLITAETGPFLKDVYDNIIQAAETVETFRELIAGIMEVNLSAASNRLNKVMKMLTIISTIFIPLNFLAGVYGMNFNFMPELDFAPAYFIVLSVMVSVGVGMLLFFKRRKWI